MRTSAPSPRIFYGWVIVLVSFLTLLLVMGTRFSFGVFYSSMLADMGWGRAATAGIFSVSMLVYALVALGVGAAFDRLGPRRMLPLMGLFLGVGFFLCSRITALWEFYLYYGVLVGSAFTSLGFIPHVALITRWLVRRRGLATSLVLSGTGLGSFVFAPWSAQLIEHYDWCTGYVWYAVLIPAVVVPLTLIGIVAGLAFCLELGSNIRVHQEKTVALRGHRLLLQAGVDGRASTGPRPRLHEAAMQTLCLPTQTCPHQAGAAMAVRSTPYCSPAKALALR